MFACALGEAQAGTVFQAQMMLRAGTAGSSAAVRAAFPAIAGGEGTGDVHAGVAALGANAILRTIAAVFTIARFAHSVSAARAAVFRAEAAVLVWTAQAVTTGVVVVAETFCQADVMLQTAATAASAAIGTTLLPVACGELACPLHAGLSAPEAGTIHGAGAAMLVGVTHAVATPGNVHTGTVLTVVVFRATAAAASAAVWTAPPALTGDELAVAVVACLTTACTRAVPGAVAAVLAECRLADAVAAAGVAIFRAGITGFYRVAQAVPAVRDIHTTPRLTLMMRRAGATLAITSIGSAFPSRAIGQAAPTLQTNPVLATACSLAGQKPTGAMPLLAPTQTLLTRSVVGERELLTLAGVRVALALGTLVVILAGYGLSPQTYPLIRPAPGRIQTRRTLYIAFLEVARRHIGRVMAGTRPSA